MSRTVIYSAIALRNRPSGQANNEVFLLTAEEGIIRATVFGGAKSKLRSHSAPYNSGQVWVYRDPAKDYSKITDFDVHSWRPGLREQYDRTMAAAATAETILSSHGGGGEWGIALKLAVETLDALENAAEEPCRRLLVHFLWRWANFLGIQPDLESCAVCENANADEVFWFHVHENSMLCRNCVPKNAKNELCPHGVSSVPSGFLQLNPGCRRWLTVTGELESSVLHRYSMDNKSFSEAKAFTAAVMTAALGKRLVSWDW